VEPAHAKEVVMSFKFLFNSFDYLANGSVESSIGTLRLADEYGVKDWCDTKKVSLKEYSRIG